MALTRRLAVGLLGQIRPCVAPSAAVLNGGRTGSLLSRCRVQNVIPEAFSPSFAATLRTGAAQLGSATYQDVQPDYESIAKAENVATSGVVDRVNQSITEQTAGRLFAVVHLNGKQFKVTDGDLVVVQGHWPPALGEHLRLEKVLLVGSADFTLIGRPVLEQGMAAVEATVIEKSLSHTKTIFRKKKRKNFKRINFCRVPLTTLRINSVRLEKAVDQS